MASHRGSACSATSQQGCAPHSKAETLPGKCTSSCSAAESACTAEDANPFKGRAAAPGYPVISARAHSASDAIPAASGAGASYPKPRRPVYSGAASGSARLPVTASSASATDQDAIAKPSTAGSGAHPESLLKDHGDIISENGSTCGRQYDFEVAKRIVALWPHEQKERAEELERIGLLFRQDVHKALEGFPEVELKWRDGDRSLDPVGFTDGDKAKIEETLGLKFIDAGGMAGGIKAVHEGLGLFLKFAFDHLGIYGSTRMAAKAAKREAAASRWVHAMDSVHVSTPLLECVDVRVSVAGAAHYEIRVQVFARVDVRSCMGWDWDAFWQSYREQHGGQAPLPTDFQHSFETSIQHTTLRVGSSDGGRSMHSDKEQMNDVLKPLARHFGIAPYVDKAVGALVEHRYAAVLPRMETADAAAETDAADGCGHDLAAHSQQSGASNLPNFLDVLQVLGMGLDSLNGLMKAVDPDQIQLSSKELAKFSKKDQDMACAAYAAIRESGVNLDYRKPVPHVQHMCSTTRDADYALHLPFDVEVHQVDSGQRFVLDTHRLLIPDVLWMDWMESDDAKPRAWVVDVGSGPAYSSAVHRYQLDSFCLKSGPGSAAVSQDAVIDALHRCCATVGERAAMFDVDSSQRHLDTGCVSAIAKDSSGQVVMVAIVACPRWYYSGPASMTCLLPPEAAKQLRQLEGDDTFEGLNPDLIMHGSTKACDKARASTRKLYQAAQDHAVGRYHHELEQATSGSDPQSCRKALKRAMHSLGLGLRHVRLLVDRLEGKEAKAQVFQALANGRTDSFESLGCWASGKVEGDFVLSACNRVKAAAAIFASAGVFTPDVEDIGELSEKEISAGGSILLPASESCLGTNLAAAGGIHTHTQAQGIVSLFNELAHVQRVRQQDVREPFDGLLKLCNRSPVLARIAIACNAVKLQAELSSSTLAVVCSPSSEPAHQQQQTAFASALGDLAGCCFERSWYQGALNLYDKCRHLYEQSLGKLHPKCAATIRSMAECCIELGLYDDAMVLFEQTRELQEAIVGTMHPDYADTMHHIAGCCMEQEQYDDAMVLYEQSRELREQVLGKEHPDYAATICSMAICLEYQGRYEEALQLHTEALQLKEAALGNQHHEYATSLNSLALSRLSLGKPEEAMPLFEQCLSILEDSLGEYHPHYAATLCNMGICLSAQGEHRQALELLKQSSELCETVLGTHHVQYANTLNAMGSCLSSLDQPKKALGVYEKCRQVRKAEYGIQSPKYLTVLKNMREACQSSSVAASQTIDVLIHLEETFARQKGKQSQEYRNTVQELVGLLMDEGRMEETQRYMDEMQALAGADSESTPIAATAT